MTSKVGRGRARGGRIIPQVPLTGTPQGKPILGRGISVVETPEQPRSLMGGSSGQVDAGAVGYTDKDNTDKVHSLGKENVKERFDEQLFKFVTKKEGHFIKITLDYFDYSDDVQYYFDKMIHSILKSPHLVEDFTKNIGLITCLKEKGDKIKSGLFKKIQLTYIDMKVLMEDSRELSVGDRQRVRAFCDLLGCLYSRFRVKGSKERYKILAKPVAQAMFYLIQSVQLPELILFNKLMILNYRALKEEGLEEVPSIDIELRSAMVLSVDNTEKLWLMSALDVASHQPPCLPAHICDFFSDQLGDEWKLLNDLHTTPFVHFQKHSLDHIKSRMNDFDNIVSKISRM